MPFSDYSDIQDEIMDAQGPKLLPAGEEVKVRIVGTRSGVAKNGVPYYCPRFEVVDDPLVMEFDDFIWDLDPKFANVLTPKSRQSTLFRMKNFALAFGIDLSGFDWDDLAGKEGWIVTGVRKDDFGEKNKVAKYVTGSDA